MKLEKKNRNKVRKIKVEKDNKIWKRKCINYYHIQTTQLWWNISKFKKGLNYDGTSQNCKMTNKGSEITLVET